MEDDVINMVDEILGAQKPIYEISIYTVATYESGIKISCIPGVNEARGKSEINPPSFKRMWVDDGSVVLIFKAPALFSLFLPNKIVQGILDSSELILVPNDDVLSTSEGYIPIDLIENPIVPSDIMEEYPVFKPKPESPGRVSHLLKKRKMQKKKKLNK